MSKIIVTGKQGILSTAVASALKENGYAVENISLRDSEWKEQSFTGCETIVHVAGVVPKQGVETDDFYRINSDLTKELACKAKADGVQQFVYISSMAVYGIEPSLSKGKGVVHRDTPCLPKTDYGKSKLLAERALEEMQDENFRVAIIRVPSIYGAGKTEYFQTFQCFIGRLRFIPKAFTKQYKSIICLENLCRLIFLIVKNRSEGLFCPDDGQISAFDLCRALMPQKKVSGLFGLPVELLRGSDRVKDYYGSVCYDADLTNIFNGEYRVCDYRDVIKGLYEN